MAVEIRRVSYAFNSLLEESGRPSYFLDCFISRDGETLVDHHGSFSTKEELYEAMEQVLPVLEEVIPSTPQQEVPADEDWKG